MPPELPGGGELWLVSGQLYAVYFIPGTQIPLMYRFSRPEEAPTTPPDRTLTRQEANRIGAIEFGITAELSDARGRDHWDIFLSNVERNAQTQPWLRDPSALQSIADAWLRGTDPVVGASEWERSLNQDQRQWLMLQGRDPQTARVRLDQARERVLGQAAEWLGPYYGAWQDDEVERWAEYLASNADQGLVELTDHLREIRMAAFPDWTDPNTTYEQIARVGRQLFTQVWGESPDERDPLFLRVAGSRDHVASMEMLRKEGWDRGVGQVVQDAVSGLMRATGGQVRRPQ
jgi:hypothetical protein